MEQLLSLQEEVVEIYPREIDHWDQEIFEKICRRSSEIGNYKWERIWIH